MDIDRKNSAFATGPISELQSRLVSDRLGGQVPGAGVEDEESLCSWPGLQSTFRRRKNAGAGERESPRGHLPLPQQMPIALPDSNDSVTRSGRDGLSIRREARSVARVRRGIRHKACRDLRGHGVPNRDNTVVTRAGNSDAHQG